MRDLRQSGKTLRGYSFLMASNRAQNAHKYTTLYFYVNSNHLCSNFLGILRNGKAPICKFCIIRAWLSVGGSTLFLVYLVAEIKMAPVEWAPIKIPLKRRLQTFTVLIQVFAFLFGHILGCVSLVLLVMWPYTIIFALLYLGWAYILNWQTPSQGGRMMPWFRRLKWWKYFCGYFPISLIKTADLDPKKTMCLVTIPMGLSAWGQSNFGSEATGVFGNVPRSCTASSNANNEFQVSFYS